MSYNKPASLHFNLDLPPKEIRGNHRSHFRTYRKFYNQYQEQGLVAIHNALLAGKTKIPLKKTLIVYTFMSNRLIDLDNFAYGMKAIQDSLVYKNVLIDDDALTIQPINRFQKCTIKERKVDVMLFDTSNYKKVSIFVDSDFLLEL